MKRYVARHVLIAQLAMLALVALCFLQAQVCAQEMTKQKLVSRPVGLAPGQSARITLGAGCFARARSSEAPQRARRRHRPKRRGHNTGGSILLFQFQP